MSYWNLDPYLDAQAFLSLRVELDKGVAELKRHQSPMKIGEHIPIYDANNQLVHGPTGWHENHKHFPRLLEFINSLPFISYHRILLMPGPVKAHFDYYDMVPWWDEFIWMQMGNKRFFVEAEGKRHYVSSTFAFFDCNHRPHGSDHAPGTYSVRVDGKLTNDFKEKAGLSGLPFRA